MESQLAKITSDYCTVLAKTSMPFIVVDYPEVSLDGVSLFAFKEMDYDSGFHKHNNKLYQFANPKNKDTGKLIKNIEKEFQKLTRLNSNAHLKLSLYDPLR